MVIRKEDTSSRVARRKYEEKIRNYAKKRVPTFKQ